MNGGLPRRSVWSHPQESIHCPAIPQKTHASTVSAAENHASLGESQFYRRAARWRQFGMRDRSHRGDCYGFVEERSVKISGMKGFRFSLWSMFLGVAAVAIVCAALVKPTAAWAIAFQAAALGVLTFALLAALVYERSAARAFWIGFAVVGWGNPGLELFPLSELSISDEISEWLMDVIHPSLPPIAPPPPAYPVPALPVALLNALAQAGTIAPYGEIPDPERAADVDPADPVPPQPSAYDTIEARRVFPHLVAWIWPLLLGFVGGVVAQQLYLRRERLAARQAPHGSGPS